MYIRINKKALAAKLGMDPKTLNKKINTFLQNKEVEKEFGKYMFRGFTYKQLLIIERETGEKILNE